MEPDSWVPGCCWPTHKQLSGLRLQTARGGCREGRDARVSDEACTLQIQEETLNLKDSQQQVLVDSMCCSQVRGRGGMARCAGRCS